MADLNKLLTIPGVWAAGEFGDDGSLLAHAGELSDEHAAMAAQMCAANNAMARMQCDGFTAMSGQEWAPLRGWALTGPLHSVCVMGNVGVFVRNAEVSFNSVFAGLGEQAALPA